MPFALYVNQKPANVSYSTLAKHAAATLTAGVTLTAIYIVWTFAQKSLLPICEGTGAEPVVCNTFSIGLPLMATGIACQKLIDKVEQRIFWPRT